MSKPTQPVVTIPAEFATNGTKTEFSAAKILSGFDRINPDILAGDNLNKFIDDTWKVANYALDLGDYVNDEVLNINQMTDCIIEAPNGVVSYSGSTITVKSGLKVLIPNGRNTDGTLKNIQKTISSDISGSISDIGNNYNYGIYLSESDAIYILRFLQPCGKHSDIPSTVPDTFYWIIYCKEDNLYYQTNGSTTANWSVIKMAQIGLLRGVQSTINYFKAFDSVKIFQNNDRHEISGYAMPSMTFVDLTLGSSGSRYTAPANGWFYLSKTAGTTAYMRITRPSGFYGIYKRTTVATDVLDVLFPCRKYDEIEIAYSATGATSLFRFYYAEGDK